MSEEPPIADERGKLPDDPEFKVLLDEFSKLSPPATFPDGEYKGKFLKLFISNPLTNKLVTTLWSGAQFSEIDRTCTMNNPKWAAWLLPEDKGLMKFAESVYDGKSCLRTDFSNRFYESRIRNEQTKEILTIVTFKTSKWISDVNLLIPVEPK